MDHADRDISSSQAPPDLDQIESLLVDLENLQNQLEQLQTALTRSHRLATLGTIAAIIAHEFNNILTPVVSYCQLAQNSPADAALTTKAVAKSLAGSTKAAQIASSILNFARDSNPQSHANIAAVVEETFNCLAREPRKDGIDLHLDIPPDLNAAIDPLALQQVLLNLVLNARHAMKQHPGSLAISAHMSHFQNENSCRISQDDAPPAQPAILITVADTGPGIPPEILDRLFEPFVTSRPSDAPKGTGLGLTVCRNLINQAQGSISVSSSPDHGTTFSIYLPQAP